MYIGDKCVFLCVSVHLNTLVYWYSQPRQILILWDMPLPVSFLCLSPSYCCHNYFPSFPPPCHHLPTRTVHHEMAITTLLTHWLRGGLRPLFSVLQHLSVCLSITLLSPWVCMFLSHSVSIYTSVFLFLSSSFSTSAPTGVPFSFCTLPAPCVCLSLSSSFLILQVFLSFLSFSPAAETFLTESTHTELTCYFMPIMAAAADRHYLCWLSVLILFKKMLSSGFPCLTNSFRST